MADLKDSKLLELKQIAAGHAIISLFRRAEINERSALALLRMEARLIEYMLENPSSSESHFTERMIEFLREENRLASACEEMG